MIPEFKDFHDLEKWYAHHWSKQYHSNTKPYKGFILDCPNGWSISIQNTRPDTTTCEISIWQYVQPIASNLVHQQYYEFPNGDSILNTEIRNVSSWIDRTYEFPSAKAVAIDEFLEKLTGKNRNKTIHNKGCVNCDNPNLTWVNDRSRREYTISGYCQDCQYSVGLIGE